MTAQPVTRPRGDKGFAFVSTLILVILLLALGSASLLYSMINAKATTHYKTGNQALLTAEAGLLHALGVINARGVQHFQADIADSANWGRLYGAASKALLMDAGSSYLVAVAASNADPMNCGSITSTGSSQVESGRVLRVALRKGIRTDPGALYLANDNVVAEFGARDQFEIDGNDHTIVGDLNPSGPLRPGIATRNDTVTQGCTDSLSEVQKYKIKGLGFSLNPLIPSIRTIQGPDVTDLDQIVNRILSTNPVVQIDNSVLPSGQYGTLAAPQVTHLTNDRVRLDGSMTGVGILIADGEFTINGSANFIGWVIVRGPTIIQSNVDDTLVDGNATIMGSLWTGDLLVQVGGSAIIDYCESCMALADGAGSGNNAPRTMRITSWQEVL